MSDGVAGFERDMVSIQAGHDAVMDKEELQEKIEAIRKLKTLHDRELWSMRLFAEIVGDVQPFWNWSEIGVDE